MDIFYAFNDAYAALAGISIYSLLENNKNCESIRFFIVDSGISEVNRKKIQRMILDSGREITFYEMPSFREILGDDVDTGRWNINVYSKLFVGSLLPDDVHRVISIDCDTVIVGSLDELWNTDISKCIVAGVNEAMSKYYRRYLGKKDDDYYLNSGMLFFNLELIREKHFEEVFVSGMKKYGRSLPYLDQDLIDAVIPQDRICLLHPKFNAITPIFCCSYKELCKTRRATTYYPESMFIEAKEDARIIHYTTFFMNNLRPWFEGSRHPKLNEFLEYKKQSPWYNEPLWKDKREKKDRIKSKVISILPKFISCSISSVLHGVIIPKRTYKRVETQLASNN